MISLINNLGVSEENSFGKNARIRIQNSFSLASTLFASPFVVYLLLKEKYWVSGIFILIQIGLVIVLLLNKYHHYKVAKILVAILYCSALPTLSISLGFDSGFYLYYFLGPLLAFHLYAFSDMSKVYKIGLLFILSLMVTFSSKLIFPEALVENDQFTMNLLFMSNLIIGIIISMLMTYGLLMSQSELLKDLKYSNKKLTKSNKEKDILLAEVHHRVKNNLAIISGLFKLQIDRSSNPDTKLFLKKNASRIHSMGLIHNQLYLEKDISSIPIKPYFEQLTEDVINSYQREDFEIAINQDISDTDLPLNVAIPLGIIFNEVILNSVTHAFKCDKLKSPAINIDFKQSQQGYQLKISDNGCGFNKEDRNNESLGVDLIDTLVEQLEGTYGLNSTRGTMYLFNIPI